MSTAVKSNLQRKLIALGACKEAVEWASGKLFFEAWEECERADWMLWGRLMNGYEQELLQGQMKLVCAWCGKTMREAQPGHEKGQGSQVPGEGSLGDESVSHGICEECLAEAKAGTDRVHRCVLNCTVHGVPIRECPVCRGRVLEVSA